MVKKNILIGLLIASSALNLTAYNDNIKVTKSDVMWSDSQKGFAAAGITGVAAKILLGQIDVMKYSVNNMPRLNPRWGMAVNTVMVGTLLAAIARDAQRKSSDKTSDTVALVAGGVVGAGTAMLPVVSIGLGQVVGWYGGGLTGEAVGLCAKSIQRGSAIQFGNRGAEIGGTIGGFVGGAAGLALSAGIVGIAVYKNASDLHKLTKPQDLE